MEDSGANEENPHLETVFNLRDDIAALEINFHVLKGRPYQTSENQSKRKDKLQKLSFESQIRVLNHYKRNITASIERATVEISLKVIRCC